MRLSLWTHCFFLLFEITFYKLKFLWNLFAFRWIFSLKRTKNRLKCWFFSLVLFFVTFSCSLSVYFAWILCNLFCFLIFRAIEFVKSVSDLRDGIVQVMRTVMLTVYLCSTNYNYPCKTVISFSSWQIVDCMLFFFLFKKKIMCNLFFLFFLYFFFFCVDTEDFINVYVLTDHPLTMRCKNCNSVVGI